MKLVPLGDRVVIKALVAEETTKSGIVLRCRLRPEIRLFILNMQEQKLSLKMKNI